MGFLSILHHSFTLLGAVSWEVPLICSTEASGVGQDWTVMNASEDMSSMFLMNPISSNDDEKHEKTFYN